MTEPVCPYCRMPFDGASPPRIFCTACGMPHHEDCYRENGGCTVFGCKCAPADDPKLQVSQSDLSSVSVPGQLYAPVYGGPPGLSQGAATAPAQLPYQQQAAPVGYQYPPNAAFGRSYKSRTAYIVLGIFLGALGVHNFYAGYVGRGVGQLCLTVLTLGYLFIIAWVWAIIEVCIVEKDSSGLNFS